MKHPDNERHVLTWIRDEGNLEYWQIDSYGYSGWFEATAWRQKVLYWQELPPKPILRPREKREG